MTTVFLVLALGILSFLMFAVVSLADLIYVWPCCDLHCFQVVPHMPSDPSDPNITG